MDSIHYDKCGTEKYLSFKKIHTITVCVESFEAHYNKLKKSHFIHNKIKLKVI